MKKKILANPSGNAAFKGLPYKVLIFILALVLLCTSCSKEKVPNEKETVSVETVQPIEKPKEEEPPKSKTIVTKLNNKVINPLTGQIIDIKDGDKRPYAVVINNLPKALPQSGISNADIYYEVLAEGGITRIIAVFQEYNAEKIGPVRSARHYFIDFAYDNDALFVHHGRSPQADAALKNNGVENLDGMELEGTAFWRDQERLNMGGMYEHSSYTSSENLLEAAENKGYRTMKDENFDYMFDFYNIDTEVGSPHDQELIIGFSDAQIAAFTYDGDSKLYARSQNNEPQIDDQDGNQIKVRNVLIQDTNIYVIPGDSEGRRNVETVSSGNGTLYTNGTMQPVMWSKVSTKSPTRWTDANGEKLKLNRGKTWICVIDE